jgi:hypothetical protein
MIPDTGCIIKYGSYFGLVEHLDLNKMTANLLLFKTMEEADDVVHELSLKQFPKWHETECPKCRRDDGRK